MSSDLSKRSIMKSNIRCGEKAYQEGYARIFKKKKKKDEKPIKKSSKTI